MTERGPALSLKHVDRTGSYCPGARDAQGPRECAGPRGSAARRMPPDTRAFPPHRLTEENRLWCPLARRTGPRRRQPIRCVGVRDPEVAACKPEPCCSSSLPLPQPQRPVNSVPRGRRAHGDTNMEGGTTLEISSRISCQTAV